MALDEMEVLAKYGYDIRNVAIWLRSGKKKPTYKVDASYCSEEKAWRAYLCQCKYFDMHMTCKHIDFVNGLLSIYPKPALDVPRPVIEGHWYRCCYCDSINFMVCPPSGFRSNHAMVCLRCGALFNI